MPKRNYICVLAEDGKPLMPTTRERHVKKLLNTGKARIAAHVPFTIQLLYDSGRETQPLCCGPDPGRTNIGICVVNKNYDAVFLAKCETRNKTIKKLMEDRKHHRQASRRGERKNRQRLAKRFSTMFAAGMRMRRLPGCDADIICKYIKNSEARFLNRKRPKGWLTPSANQLLETHIHLIEMARKFLPITDVSLEVNRFSFASMENPEITGIDFQNGPLKGFDSVEDAVYAAQKGICLLCGKRHIERYHHIVPQHEGGSNTLLNIAGVCESCHTAVHTDKEAASKLKSIKEGQLKKYGALSVLNQVIPYLAAYLIKEFGDRAHFTTGYETSIARENLSVKKDRETNPCHELDAYIIALKGFGLTPKGLPDCEYHFIKQYRRQDRSLIQSQRERTYKLNGKTVAKNRRKRFEQHDDSLHEWYLKQVQSYGKKEARKMQSQLKVIKSTRRYNNPDRLMPGAEFWYHGKRYIIRGQQNSGYYLLAEGYDNSKRFRSSECYIRRQNTGLVFIY